MSNVPSSRPIRSPGELRDLLEELRAALDARRLDEVLEGRSELTPAISVEDVLSDGRWPDAFELRFREPATGKTFKLEVETFHGAGGSWTEVND